MLNVLYRHIINMVTNCTKQLWLADNGNMATVRIFKVIFDQI